MKKAPNWVIALVHYLLSTILIPVVISVVIAFLDAYFVQFLALQIIWKISYFITFLLPIVSLWEGIVGSSKLLKIYFVIENKDNVVILSVIFYTVGILASGLFNFFFSIFAISLQLIVSTTIGIIAFYLLSKYYFSR